VRPPSARDPHFRLTRGFTLIELGVVILIISIVLSFIIVASMGAAENARVRATQALITKLEIGLNERLSALTSVTPPVNGAHAWLASINPPGFAMGSLPLPWGLTSGQRAQVIARFDQMRMELPDVFYIQNYNPGNDDYIVNFAGLPYNPEGINVTGPLPYVLPLGHLMPRGFNPGPGDPPYTTNASDPNLPYWGPGAGMIGPGLGIYGASYTARGALHKLIGYGPEGIDGADNNGNGLVDEHSEGISNGDGGKIQAFLANHNHETARAEMLYALLVEGSGPMGSVFGKAEFKEGVDYRDTDNDGVPEFVDGWGKPLQFYRWPIYYGSPSVQLGAEIYGNTFQPRAPFPLDPNNQLVAPAWWGDLTDTTVPINPSFKALLFQRYFTSLIDPNYGAPSTVAGNYWDRTGGYGRRSFGCKFLVISGGPDQQVGLYQLSNDVVRQTGSGSQPDQVAALILGDPTPTDPANDYTPQQFGENWAVFVYESDEGSNPQAYIGYPRQRAIAQMVIDNVVPAPPRAALDNIDNHNLQLTVGGVR
jgi:prepilin-type N-terminal cleavage/methylation domain-containing protein